MGGLAKGKAVGRTSGHWQGLLWGQCTPSVVSESFAVVLPWAAIRIGCPKPQVSLSLRSATKRLRSMNSQFRSLKVKVEVYTGSHQRASRKSSQLVLTLARAPPKDKKEKQQRLMRIQRIVSHAIRPAPSPPEASRSTSNPPSRSPIITVAVVKVYFASCFCDLV